MDQQLLLSRFASVNPLRLMLLIIAKAKMAWSSSIWRLRTIIFNPTGTIFLDELKTPVWSEPYFDEGAGNILMATYSVPFFQRDGRHSAGPVNGDRHCGCLFGMAY